MTGVFTIDSIEGNSHIGVPVFSRYGKKSNYHFIVFSPEKKSPSQDTDTVNGLLLDNAHYKVN